jgi:hypothetical protein
MYNPQQLPPAQNQQQPQYIPTVQHSQQDASVNGFGASNQYHVTQTHHSALQQSNPDSTDHTHTGVSHQLQRAYLITHIQEQQTPQQQIGPPYDYDPVGEYPDQNATAWARSVHNLITAIHY